MSHIQRRAKDRWRARYIDPNGRERSRTFPRKVDAERFLATVDADLVRREWVDPRLGKKTFREWADEFESSRVDLEATTQAQHAAYLRNHLLPRFGDQSLAAITEMQVRAFVAQLVKDGLAPATVTKNLRILSQILKAAVRNPLISDNPCDGVKGPGEARHWRRRSSSAPSRSTPWPMRWESGSHQWCCGRIPRAALRRAGGPPAPADPVPARKLDVVEPLKESGDRLYFGPPKYGRVRTKWPTWRRSRRPRISSSRARRGRCSGGRTSSGGSERSPWRPPGKTCD